MWGITTRKEAASYRSRLRKKSEGIPRAVKRPISRLVGGVKTYQTDICSWCKEAFSYTSRLALQQAFEMSNFNERLFQPHDAGRPFRRYWNEKPWVNTHQGR